MLKDKRAQITTIAFFISIDHFSSENYKKAIKYRDIFSMIMWIKKPQAPGNA